MTRKDNTKLQATMTVAYEDHNKSLNKHAFFKLNDPGVSEDMVQETFLKTWKYLVKGGKIHLMKAFLYHVLNGLIIDQYRKRKPTSLDSLLEKGFEPGIDDSDRLFDSIDGNTAASLIERLPAKYREVMTMKYVKGLTLEEMSLISKKSKNTIAVQVHRGLQKLKALHILPPVSLLCLLLID